MDDILRTAPTAEELKNDPDSREDYGTKRHSGRYPWGSGDNPYQRLQGRTSFLGRLREMKKQGMSEIDRAHAFGFKTTDELRKAVSQADAENKRYYYGEVYRLKQKGLSNVAIAKRLGLPNESTVRGMLDESRRERLNKTQHNADILREAVNSYGYIDVGGGVEKHLGITETRLHNAVALLQKEGYVYEKIKVEQQGTGKFTTVAVLTKPGTTKADIYKHAGDIQLPFPCFSEDGGETMTKINPHPVSVDSKRIDIRYAEDGGTAKDGIIELRRGVPDISLGNAKYVQARIAVDGTHYLKGMAMYSDDLPDGIDIRFNTNKHKGTPMMSDDPDAKTVLKPMEKDPDNPFGASIKPEDKLTLAQRYYTDANGEKKLSAINVVNEEGDWEKWSKSLSTQFLSKQPVALAKQQLKLAKDISESEFEEINKLTNPTVKRMLLEEFAGNCESDAVHMAAAALPRQATKVILPVPTLKDNEVYAPSFREGEEVVLIRYPHAGTFEIPRLTVTHRNPEGKSAIGDTRDAIGINPKTAEQLSGADFDGDNVLVIPTSGVNIQAKKPLAALKDFDPKEEYKGYPGMHKMTEREKHLEMGRVSNLITDMTLLGAPEEDIVRAVKHSMVVIDAKKHNLDYRRSEQENDIPGLRKKWLGREDAGASTLISRATGEEHIDMREEKPVWKLTPEEKKRWDNGEIIWENTGSKRRMGVVPRKLMTPEEKEAWDTGDKLKRREIRSRAKEDGRLEYKEELRKQTVERLYLHEDAYDLVKGNKATANRTEVAYAEYSNAMKDLARRARKEARHLDDIAYDPKAAQVYAQEVKELNAALSLAQSNAPLERRAQLIASRVVAKKLYENPNMENDKKKRLKGQELDRARRAVGAKKQTINITDKQWEAINAGAITKTKLKAILSEANKDRVKQLATPRRDSGLSNAQIARAKSMLAKGYSQADVADIFGVSPSTISRVINGEG